MKKYFLLIAAAATVFAVSCRKAREVEQVTTETPQEEIDDTTPQPIRFGSSLNVTVDTKAAVENWGNADALYIYGLEKNFSGTSFTYAFSGARPYIANVEATAPANRAGEEYHPNLYDINVWRVAPEAPATEGEPFYYVDGKVYDFFGYHVGSAYAARAAVEYADYNDYNLYHTDAPLADQAAYTALDDANKVKVAAVIASDPEPTETAETTSAGATVALNGVKIDFTQDVMRAGTDPDFDIDHRIDQSKYVPENKMYSSYSSRRTVIPNLKFDHQLSRFKFFVKKGGTVDVDKMNIDHIDIESFIEGNLTIVGAPTVAAVQTWDVTQAQFVDATGTAAATQDLYFNPVNEAKRYYLPLRDKNNQDAVATVVGTVNPLAANEYHYFGEAMVFPGQTMYRVKVYRSQTGVTGYVEPLEVEVDLKDLKLNGEAVADKYAKPGYQYNVNLIVYGFEEIKVTVSLSEWVEGGDVIIDTDADENDPRTAATLSVAVDELNVYAGEESAAFEITTDTSISASCSEPGIKLVNVSGNSYKVTVAGPGSTNAVAAGDYVLHVRAASDFTHTATIKDIDIHVAAARAENSLAVANAGTITLTDGVGTSAAAVITTAGEGGLTIVSVLGEGENPEDQKAFFSINGDKLAVAKVEEMSVAAGNYTVTVSAAGDSTHKPVTKTFTVTIAVPVP